MRRKKIMRVALLVTIALILGSFSAFADFSLNEVETLPPDPEAAASEQADSREQDFIAVEIPEENEVIPDSGEQEASEEADNKTDGDTFTEIPENTESFDDESGDEPVDDSFVEVTDDPDVIPEELPQSDEPEEDSLTTFALDAVPETDTYTITDNKDDAEEYGTNKSIHLTDRDAHIGGYDSTSIKDSHKTRSAFRFVNVNLPEGAEIQEAYMEFIIRDTTKNRVSNMEIRAELGNPAQYTTAKSDISNRSYGNTVVRFQQDAFTVKRTAVRTPDLSGLINEARQSGWQDGQALAFVIDGDNYIGSVYQGGTEYSPKLVITYVVNGNGSGDGGTTTDPTDVRDLYINEIAPNGTGGSPWIEFYNEGSTAVQMDDRFFLTTNEQEPNQYAVTPSVVGAGSFYAMDLSSAFTLGGEGETLYLMVWDDGEYRLLDSFQLSTVESGQTLGRFTDGNQHIVAYKGGTRGYSNNQLTPMLRFAISHDSGAYDEPFVLELITDSANTVRYTTDGTTPSESNGSLYAGGISINDTTTVKILVYNDRIRGGVLTYAYNLGEGGLDMHSTSSEFPIRSGNDDAMVSASKVNLTSNYLNLHGVLSGTRYDTYLRFANVSVPSDAVVTKAYLKLTTYSATNGSPTIRVSGETGGGAAFGSQVESFTGRQFTSSYVEMTAPSVANKTVVSTMDLSSVVNEMLSYDKSRKNFVFKLEGSQIGSHQIRSYDYNESYAPVLVLEYSSGFSEYSTTITDYHDDAAEYGANQSMNYNESIDMGGYRSSSLSTKQRVAFRFGNVEIPADAEIEDAYIEFTSNGTGKGTSNMEVRAEIGNAATYNSTRGNISSRNYTNLAVYYKQEPITASKQVLRTGNLKSIIDEARLSGWNSGMALAFVLDGDNHSGKIYQGGTNYPPKLVIKYKYSGSGAFIDGAMTDPEKIRNIFVNEVSAEGTTKSKETWVELYNANDYPVVLGPGTYLSHNAKKPENFEFSNVLIPAKSVRVIYCDKKTELGNDHASFEVKASGDVLFSAKQNGKTVVVDTLSYSGHAYNQTAGRRTDGGEQIVTFAEETFGASNNTGMELYPVQVSHDRGVYDTGFTLTIESNPGTTIRYTMDGSSPNILAGTIYSGPINISRSSVVKIFAYDSLGHSTVLPYTYVLKDNLRNETRDGSQWRYLSTITSAQYAQALSEFPVFAISTNLDEFKRREDYVQVQFEYLDSHLGGTNFVADVGGKKFGQVSAGQFNSNVAVRFKRDYNSKKAKYPFFADKVAGDQYPPIGKYARLDLKEGQDGPQNDIYSLGYLRYSESVTNTLAKQMGKFGLATQYVHYFHNGEYRGLKTMREHFNDNMAEEYFGGSNDEYTRITYQDGSYSSGKVEDGDGDPNMLATIKAVAKSGDFQQFKRYVNVEDFIKMQILYMFVDTEREVDALIHNDVLNGGMKMIFNINDTDGAVNNDKKTGTTASTYAGGGGTYRYKWNSDSKSRNGPGGMFGVFSGNSTDASKGNLEFKTLVKDQVLLAYGPMNGDSSGVPLSVSNVKALIKSNQDELVNAYRVDAAYMSAHSGMYERWQTENAKVLNQVDDRVTFTHQMWLKYNMAHSLQAVKMYDSGSGIVLDNPNGNTKIYYTTDGSDPMGANGAISSSAVEYSGETIPMSSGIVIRPFTTNNWGPLTTY